MTERNEGQVGVLENWFSRGPYTAEELNYRLGLTEAWEKYSQRSPGDGKGVRLSISDLERAIPFLLRRLGFNDIDLPGLPNKEMTVYSITGTALHEAEVLIAALMAGLGPSDIDRILPCSSNRKREPFKRAVERFRVKHGMPPDELESVIDDAWDFFHCDPDLVESQDLPGWEREFLIRKSEDVALAGRRLIEQRVKEYDPDAPPSSYLKYFELSIVGNFKCGLQLISRVDGVWAREENGHMHFYVKDLKTGKHDTKDEVGTLIHEWEYQLIIIQSQIFCNEYLSTGFLNIPNSLYILYGVDHTRHSRNPITFCYDWFDKRTGEIVVEEAKIEDRRELNEKIDWLANAARAFKPELRNYLSTGDEELAPKKSKKKPSESDLIQMEFEDTVRGLDEKVGQINDQIKENQHVKQKRHRDVYRIGFFETEEECDCGGKIGRDCQFQWGRRLRSRVSVEDKCMNCGKVIKQKETISVWNRDISSG